MIIKFIINNKWSFPTMLLGSLIFILPFYFLPITVEFYNFNKQGLIFVFTLLALFYWLIDTYRNRTVKISFSSHDRYLFVFIASVWLSFFVSLAKRDLASPDLNPITSTFGPFTFSALVILYFFAKNFLTKDDFERLPILFIVSGTVFSLLTLGQEFGLNLFLKFALWSPLGVSSNVLIYLGIVCAVIVMVMLKKFSWRLALSFLLVFSALGYSFYLIFLNNSTRLLFLPFNEGWNIAISILKDLKNAIFGVGPGNFSLALAANRPASLTSQLLTSLSFPWQANLYLQIITEYGLLSFVIFLSLIFQFVKAIKLKTAFSYLPVVSFLILQLFFYPSLVGLFYFFLFLSLINYPDSKDYHLNIIKFNRLLKPFFLLISVLIFVFSFLYLRFYAGEVYYKKAIDSQLVSINLKTYQNIFQAINLNSQNPNYQDFLSRISLSSALDLAAKKNAGEEKKNELIRLMDQSVREGRKAIALAPYDPYFYASLGQTYLSLSQMAKGSLPLAQENYVKAISLDSRNPNYYFGLGQAYLLNSKYDLAQRQFEIAAFLDPTFANAYYSLFYVLYLQGQYQAALSNLTQTKNLIPINHPQYSQINKQLEEFSLSVKEASISGKMPANVSSVSPLLPTDFSRQTFGQIGVSK